jgi:hypothetical protein
MNKFERGLTDREIRDTILDRIPAGTLYFSGGRFPYLFMLKKSVKKDVNNPNPPGNFINIGHFKGGGGRKTEFVFVSQGESYEYLIKWVYPAQTKPKLWARVETAVESSLWSIWESIEEKNGIKPIMP